MHICSHSDFSYGHIAIR